MKRKAPAIPREVVEWLESLYPDRMPNLGLPKRELYARIGQVQVVRRLRAELERQTEDALTR